MPRIRYNVPVVRQHRSPVCWLACAIMLEQFKRGRTLDVNEMEYDQGDFRMASIRNVPQISMWDSFTQLISGQDATSQSFISSFLRQRGFSLKRMSQLRISQRPRQRRPTMNDGRAIRRNTPSAHHRSIRDSVVVEKLITLLRNHGPFILFHHCGSFSYGPAVITPNQGAHAVLITGIDTREHVFYFNNPSGQKNVTTTIDSIIGAIRRWESDRSRTPSVASF